MKITLYRAAETYREILDQIDPETGEIPEGFLEEFDNAKGLVKNKGTSVAAYILQQEAEMALVSNHARELMSRVVAQTKRNEWLRQYLRDNMLATGINQIEGEGFLIKLYRERDEAIEIFDSRQVPPEFDAEPKPPEPSKTKIKAAIKAGNEVPGAKLVKRDRLEIK